MRTLAVGDIHGCYAALTTLAALVPFRPADTLITLGDYVDRGPDSFAVLDWLIDYAKCGKLVALRGNHEVMMLAARDSPEALGDWLGCGVETTLMSYSPLGDAGKLADVPDNHWAFLNSTTPYHETRRHVYVHASAYADYPKSEQPEFMLYWEPFERARPHESGKVLVCGHTPQKSGVPASVGYAMCLDTDCCRGGWLTCCEVESGRYWQASELGETRSGWLGE